MWVALGGASTAHASLTFEPVQPFDQVPKAGGDFDGDGVEDIITTSGTNVVIHYSDGVGGFVRSGEFPTGSGTPVGLVVADFDGDDLPDVATANWGSDDMSVLMHDGADGLLAPVTFDAVDMPTGLAAADFDGDGETDLVVSPFQDDEIAFHAGDGQGAFGPAVLHSAGGNPTELVWGDFDGDGHDDVAVALDGLEAVQLLLGKDEGTDGTVLEAPVAVGGGLGAKRLATGDLNGDTSTDLGILNVTSGTVETVLGNEGRSFTAALQVDPDGEDREDLAFADFDGDGLDDLVYGETSPVFGIRDIVLSIGDGQGGFDFQGRFPALLPVDDLLTLHLNEDEEVDVATDGGIFLGTALTVEPAVVEFPTRRVGSTGNPVTVIVENSGTVDYRVLATELLVGDGAFAVGADSCTGVDVPAAESCSIALTFAAPAVGLHEDDLLVDTTAGLYGVALSGRALAVPSVDATPASLAFPDVSVGNSSSSLSVEVANRGDAPVAIGSVSPAGADATAFQVLTNGCASGTLAPLASCSVSIRFTPARTGSHTATLRVEHDGQGGVLSVPIAGNGAPPFSVDVGAIDFGEVQVGQRAGRTVTVTRHGAGPLEPVSAGVSGPDVATLRSSFACMRAPTCALRVTFAPDSARRHSAQLTVAARGFQVVVPLTGVGTVAPKPAPNVAALLRSRLRSAVRGWRRGGLPVALRRGLPVTGFRAPANGTLRLVVRKAEGPVLARASVRTKAGVRARVRARLTRAGRRALRSGRAVRVVAALEFVPAQGGRRSRARATALLR